MVRIKEFLGDESASAEAVSVAVMIGALSSGLTGLWNVLAINSTVIILAIIGALLLLWLIFKH